MSINNLTCPMCGGHILKGYCLSEFAYQKSSTIKITRVKHHLFDKYYDVRARVCSDCGHIDLIVHPDDLKDLVEDKMKRK